MGSTKITAEVMITLMAENNDLGQKNSKVRSTVLMPSPISSQSKEAKYKGRGHIDLV